MIMVRILHETQTNIQHIRLIRLHCTSTTLFYSVEHYVIINIQKLQNTFLTNVTIMKATVPVCNEYTI